jgi:hypothetical protein
LLCACVEAAHGRVKVLVSWPKKQKRDREEEEGI